MLKKTFLEALNAEAQSLGSPPVTDRILRDWILEDLFSGPREKGRGRGSGSEWSYSPAALRAALEIVRLKASGATRRNTVLRIRVWLVDLDVPMRRVAEDLKSEFSRLVRKHFFRIPLRYDARSGNFSERDVETDLRRAGPLDSTLADAGLAPPLDDILRFISELSVGSAQPPQVLRSVEELISPFLSEKGSGNSRRPSAGP